MRKAVELGAFVCGVGAVIFGLAQIYGPAGWIAGGLTVAAFAWWSRKA